MPTCLVVQHVAPEPAFAFEEALRAAGVDVDTRRAYAGDALPADTAGLDGLLVMGGPMSATSDAGFPSRRAELHLLSDALEAGIPTVGVCLGAQLLAVAGGGSVAPGPHGPEIGWLPVGQRLLKAYADSRVECDDPDVSVVAVKRADVGAGVIVRLMREELAPRTAHLEIVASAGRIWGAFRCDAREEDDEPLAIADGRALVPLRARLTTVRLIVR